MLKLLKYMKMSAAALLFVTILLFLQAYCDLSLPSYTSNIINVGIMQGGIKSPVPEVIRASELDKITLFMGETEKSTLMNHYTLLKEEDYSQAEWSDYIEKYPLLRTEALYIWDKKDAAGLADILTLPIMIKTGLESGNAAAGQMKELITSSLPAGTITEDMDLITILASLPAEARISMTNKMGEAIRQMPEMIQTQTAAAYVKSEYEAIGIQVSKIQSGYVILTGLKMLGLALLAMAASILVTYISARIAAKLGKELRIKVFKKVLSFSNTEMDQFSTASLITRSTNDIQQVQNMIVMTVRIVIYSPVLALGGIFKVVATNTSMTWTLGAGVAAIFILIAALLIVAMPKFKLMPKLVDKINLVTREVLTGLPVIRAFSTEEHEKKRFDRANVDLTKNMLFVNRVMAIMMPSLMMIMNLVSILIIWVGADRINSGTMQVGDMVAFIQYTMQIIMSFLMLTMISVMLPRAGISAKRIDEIISKEEIIKDPKVEEAPDSGIKGVLEFNHVHFCYPGAEEDVLSDISFIVKPGETTAIIGSTGCGKSTMINLIPRFYDVTSGSILINGTDIRKIGQHTLRDKLGFVPQQGVLFSGTVESNISFGNPGAVIEEIRNAARIAQASEFIDEMPEGYQSRVAEGGTNVSGGQKQRLSIARAIAKNPEIYIFDDSFSALDYKTDAALRKTLKQELSDSSVIIVTQRISTVMDAKNILVLDDGRIVGRGTHKELLRDCEVYRQIASSQLSKEELMYE